MSYLTSKNIGGKRYFFLVKSVRIGGGIEKISISLGDKKPNEREVGALKEGLEPAFSLREAELKADMGVKEYSSKHFSLSDLRSIETLRYFYKIYLRKLKPSELEKYKENFMVRYVYNTTSIEGNTTTLPETALILVKKIAPKGKMLREIYEIQNYEKMIEFMSGYTEDISKKMILKIHKILMRNIDENAGNIRKNKVFIPGSYLKPPPPEKVEPLIDELIGYYYESKGMCPLELAVTFHHKFETIHPFCDGNGRVGRELLNFILQKKGFPPVIIEVKERQKYIKSLMKADKGKMGPLIEFVGDTLIKQYDCLMELDRKEIEKKVAKILGKKSFSLANIFKDYRQSNQV